jgi:alkyl sulfatase BDS1-like metallo-beta-lactamase superfamily hydrolase
VQSHLKPAPQAQQAREIATLAGGVEKLAARGGEKLAAGELALASHLIDWAAFAAPNDKAIHELRAKIYGARAEQSSSTMSSGIFSSAARESAEKAGIPPPNIRRRLF